MTADGDADDDDDGGGTRVSRDWARKYWRIAFATNGKCGRNTGHRMHRRDEWDITCWSVSWATGRCGCCCLNDSNGLEECGTRARHSDTVGSVTAFVTIADEDDDDDAFVDNDDDNVAAVCKLVVVVVCILRWRLTIVPRTTLRVRSTRMPSPAGDTVRMLRKPSISMFFWIFSSNVLALVAVCFGCVGVCFAEGNVWLRSVYDRRTKKMDVI